MDIQIHEAQSSPNKINLQRSSPRHIIIELSKIKDKEIILKAARGSLQGNPHKAIRKFFSRNLTGQERWDNIVKVLKEIANQEYLTWQSCPSETLKRLKRLKTFPDKQNLGKFVTRRPTLQEMLKELFELKWKDAN